MFLTIILGITSSGKTFTIGVCFLPGENREDIEWALREFQKLGINPELVVTDGDGATKNAVEEVFEGVPTMLCIWHVNQRVLAYCKGRVGNDGWNDFDQAWRSILASRTVEEFNERWLQFCTTYSNEKTQACVDYLKKEWLKDGQKERLVSAWTSHYRHYNTLVTSR